MSPSRLILVCASLGAALFGWISWRGAIARRQSAETAAPVITKQPVNFASRKFDPANPPPDMPPLPSGENAECDTNFLSSAIVGGQLRRTDSTHAILTVSQVSMTLQLNVTVWVPPDASEQVIDHEEGHRQISEYYYATADKLAAQIASSYIGKQVDIAGDDLNVESDNALRQMAAEITGEYNKELNPNPTQLLYDSITDHSRNGVDAKDAVAHALKNVLIESP